MSRGGEWELWKINATTQLYKISMGKEECWVAMKVHIQDQNNIG